MTHGRRAVLTMNAMAMQRITAQNAAIITPIAGAKNQKTMPIQPMKMLDPESLKPGDRVGFRGVGTLFVDANASGFIYWKGARATPTRHDDPWWRIAEQVHMDWDMLPRFFAIDDFKIFWRDRDQYFIPWGPVAGVFTPQEVKEWAEDMLASLAKAGV